MKKNGNVKTKKNKKAKTGKKIKNLSLTAFLFIFFSFFIVSFLIFGSNNVPKNEFIPGKKITKQDSKKYVSEIKSVEVSKEKKIEITPTPEQNGFCIYTPILLYHHIEPLGLAAKEGHQQLTVDSTWFEKQLQYLNEKGYRSIFAEELVDALKNHQNLGKTVMITIDDGYIDIYNYAYPLAKTYNIKLNLMIPSGLIGNSGYMSWENLKEMSGSGLVTFYDHTWSHYSLTSGNYQKDETEIMMGKKQLEEMLGRQVNIFSYPYGTSNDQVIGILKKNGFTAAFSTISSYYQCEGYIYNLRRNRIGSTSLSYYGL